MTTFERLKNYFSESGLSDDFIQQDYIWNEKEGNDSDSYIVFQQPNGTGRIDDLSGDDFFTVSLISGKAWIEFIVQRANEILEYVRCHSRSHNIGFIINTSGFVNPIQTTEGRFIIPLSFRCTS
ncbi:phage tail termination protein [Proteus mirabilis]|uniref:phage tail termination protein n=1 Tax=Proteus mirabilis TaxID=584 RepID=UPI0034D6C9C2